jgi:hypothetical protein
MVLWETPAETGILSTARKISTQMPKTALVLSAGDFFIIDKVYVFPPSH